MRLQLLVAFTLVIVIAVGASWLLAVRTTDNQFAVLVLGNKQRQAELFAPVIVDEYQRLGSWEAMQTEFDKQADLEAARLSPNVTAVSGGASQFPDSDWTVGMTASLEDGTMIWRIETLPLDSLVINASPDVLTEGTINYPNTASAFSIQIPSPRAYWGRGDAIASGDFINDVPQFGPMLERATLHPLIAPVDNNGNVALVIEQSGLSWISIITRRDDQRAIVVDNRNMVVVDSEKSLMGQRVDANFLQNGFPLSTADDERIGTFVVTSPNGVFTLEQSSFLKQVRAGLLYGGVLSAGLALFLALVIAERITHPIRSLTTATARIQAGEWGYQVPGSTSVRNEIGQLKHAFNQMSNHLSEQRRLRGRLVDDLAHELNTPLSLMRLELQAMVDGMQSPAEAAEHLNQELEEVAELVSDLIFLASKDAARTPRMDWIDLNDLVEATLRRFGGSAGQNLTLRFEPTPSLPPLYADPDLVQRAISNLVTNALRCTLPGGSVSLTTRQRGQNLEVMVRDTGIGIAEEHLPHIFERFYRVDDSRSRDSGGRGLGLAIVRQIMDQHQGQVHVESRAGLGSTFTLAWPVPSSPA